MNTNDGQAGTVTTERFDPTAPDPKARKRRWPLRAGLAAFVLLLVAGFWPRALVVETAAAARGPLRVTVDEEGQTRVRHRHVVSSPVGGQLRRIELRAGAAVRAGETVLAELETAGAELLDASALAQAEARVGAAESHRAAVQASQLAAEATRRLADAELARQRALAGRDLISAQELETAEMRAVTAQQEERAATFAAQVAVFELEQARAVLRRGLPAEPGAGAAERGPRVTLRSPVDGVVLRVFQESARVVPGGTELLEVGDPRDLEVRVEILSRDGVAVRPGAPVLLERWGGEGVLEARVRLVEPAAFTKVSALGVEEQRVNLIADFTEPVERRAGLGDAFRVEARIVVWEEAAVLKVPAGALFQRDGAWKTFVVEGGRARLRAVEVGRTNGVEAQVLGGLEPDDMVIVYPGDRIGDGTRVRGL
jgi:HlyD family secretion protein